MIGYYCITCSQEHAYLGDCPYEKHSELVHRSYKNDSDNIETVSIPANIKVGESVRVYLQGRFITLRRTK